MRGGERPGFSSEIEAEDALYFFSLSCHALFGTSQVQRATCQRKVHEAFFIGVPYVFVQVKKCNCSEHPLCLHSCFDTVEHTSLMPDFKPPTCLLPIHILQTYRKSLRPFQGSNVRMGVSEIKFARNEIAPTMKPKAFRHQGVSLR